MSLHALYGLCWEHLRPGGAQHKPPIPPEGDITMNPRITTPASAGQYPVGEMRTILSLLS